MAADKSYTKDFFFFHKALKQRNAALKQTANMDLIWSEIFASSEFIYQEREKNFLENKSFFQLF